MSEYNISLKYTPRPWQEFVHRNRKHRNVLVCHRRAGKTVAAIMELVDEALKATKPMSRYSYVAPFLRQAKNIAWSMLKDKALMIPETIVSESELWVEFPNGARVRLYGADNSDALRGTYNDGLVADEFADFPVGVMGSVILPTLADRNGWLILMGTPKGIDQLSETYYLRKDDPAWFAALFAYGDTNALSPEAIADLKATMLPREFALEMECKFDSGTADTLLTGTDVDEAQARVIPQAAYQYAARILGVDVARQGDDRSCIVMRQGLRAFDPVLLKGADTIEVANAVIAEYEKWDADAIFVDGSGGYGAGVIDYLRNLGHFVYEVQFGGKPRDDRFKNKRAEMHWDLAHWIRNGGSLPHTQGLKVELCATRYFNDNDSGKLQLESKADLKGRGLNSPDVADGLALTFAAPVEPRNRHGEKASRKAGRTNDDWDPHA